MLSKQEYIKKTKASATKSKLVQNFIKAFVVGGLICTLGQLIFNITRAMAPVGSELPKMITPMVLILISGILTGLCLFDDIAKFSGAGSGVPITGFANAVVAPAMEFKKEGIVLGMCSKMFIIAGPVLVFGITTSILYGVVYYIINFIMK